MHAGGVLVGEGHCGVVDSPEDQAADSAWPAAHLEDNAWWAALEPLDAPAG